MVTEYKGRSQNVVFPRVTLCLNSMHSKAEAQKFYFVKVIFLENWCVFSISYNFEKNPGFVFGIVWNFMGNNFKKLNFFRTLLKS